MTAPTTAREAWRVATRTPHSPAHRYINFPCSHLTYCGAILADGVLLTREQAFEMQAHPCRKCLKGLRP